MLDAREGSNFSVEINAQGQFLFSKKVIPMQFIGLKDKKSVEIYEGDLFKGTFGSLYEVRWNKLEAGWQVFDYLDHSNWYMGKIELLEVIGNIYENPKLLK